MLENGWLLAAYGKLKAEAGSMTRNEKWESLCCHQMGQANQAERAMERLGVASSRLKDPGPVRSGWEQAMMIGHRISTGDLSIYQSI